MLLDYYLNLYWRGNTGTYQVIHQILPNAWKVDQSLDAHFFKLTSCANTRTI